MQPVLHSSNCTWLLESGRQNSSAVFHLLQSVTLLTQWFHWQPCQSCHALILPLIISALSASPRYDQTQINRYHCPSNAAIKLSLYLNLKCLSCRSAACKYAHVWLRGQWGRQELGRNAYFLEQTAQRGRCGGWVGSANHASALRHFSDARRHTSEMNNKAGRWARGRSQEVDDFTCWGVRPVMDRYAGVNILREGNGCTLCWPPLSMGLSSGWARNS